MIEYVKGELADLTPAYAVVEAHGVGYGMNISLNTYTAIQGKKEVRLWVYEAIREDAYALFGFATKQERDMFLLLITVSGVGANTARMILSEMTVSEICNVISTGNERVLKSVKGIGLRTAQRIIVDLKDKIISSGIAQELPSNAGNETVLVNSSVKDEAVGALTMLGFSPAPSAKVVIAILKEQPDLPVEQVVKLALKQIK
ncbi:MAG: Holliday junction branch migration protein RuvA [Prevotella sp.]|nr:Holliday junction branch migration protein RuvA [Prevotella sp.]MBR1464411.1 Holliday junction branch migration protein RuvA [Prevotella sp.]